jgi:hypothetical protein
MEANGCAEMGSFGRQHFGGCQLGDKRLTDRLVQTTDRFLQHPGGTLPDKLNRNAELMGFYRMANNPRVTHAALIATHAARTRQLIERTTGVVLIIHDTTEVDFSGLDSVQGLGQIGHGGCRGFLCHNSLAVDYDGNEVLGLVSQLIHVRRKVPKKESPRAKREHPQRESRLWKKGWIASALADKRCIHLADRGADMLEFMEALHLHGDHYVVRSKSNRNIELDDGRGGVRTARLHDYARSLPSLGERSVKVSTNHGHQGRVTRVSVSAAEVSIRPPHYARGEHSANNLPAWVIYVREIDAPAGEKPLEWILLSNVAAATFEQVGERIDWYACRPIIEEYHKAQKTGCGIELPQFTTAHALQVSIAIFSVVATQLLRLRDLARREDARVRPASEVVDAEYITALSYWRFRKVQPELSIHDFLMMLAKLGGHLNRKHDGPPGWLVLWRGWTKLQPMVDGIRAARMMKG